MVESKGARTTAKLVASMLELIQQRGYAGTGLNAVAEHAKAPKGSLYFHFPQGKEALGEKAVELAALQFGTLVISSAQESATPAETVHRVIDVLAGILTDSDYQLGCPVSVVTLEMGAYSERLRSACANAFESWITPVTEYLVVHGHSPRTARSLATSVVSLVEGAVIISRAQHSTEPLRCAAETIAHLLGTDAEATS